MASPSHSDSKDTDALLRLVLAGGRSAPRRQLLDYHGTPHAALAAGPNAWRASGCNTMQCTRLVAPDPNAMARIQHWLATPYHHLLGWHDPDYPPLLRHVPSPPLALFIAGNPILLWHASIAIVGSRQPSAGGLDHSYGFAQALAARGLGIISGMAAGIDATAHEAALSIPSGHTVAVLGTAQMCHTQHVTKNCTHVSPQTERSSANIHQEPNHGLPTFHNATGLLQAWRWAHWWSKLELVPAH